MESSSSSAPTLRFLSGFSGLLSPVKNRHPHRHFVLTVILLFNKWGWDASVEHASLKSRTLFPETHTHDEELHSGAAEAEAGSIGHSDTLPRSRCAASPSTSGQRRVRRGESEPELYKVFVPTGLGRCGV